MLLSRTSQANFQNIAVVLEYICDFNGENFLAKFLRCALQQLRFFAHSKVCTFATVHLQSLVLNQVACLCVSIRAA